MGLMGEHLTYHSLLFDEGYHGDTVQQALGGTTIELRKVMPASEFTRKKRGGGREEGQRKGERERERQKKDSRQRESVREGREKDRE